MCSCAVEEHKFNSVHFLTLTLEEVRGLYAAGHITVGKEHLWPLNRRLGGSDSRSGRFGEDKNILPLQ